MFYFSIYFVFPILDPKISTCLIYCLFFSGLLHSTFMTGVVSFHFITLSLFARSELTMVSNAVTTVHFLIAPLFGWQNDYMNWIGLVLLFCGSRFLYCALLLRRLVFDFNCIRVCDVLLNHVKGQGPNRRL